MSEKRNENRSPIELAASFGIDGTQARTENISISGVCIISNHKVKTNETIDLEVELNDTETVKVKARACWCEAVGDGTYRVGVEVKKYDSEDYRKFAQFYHDQQ